MAPCRQCWESLRRGNYLRRHGPTRRRLPDRTPFPWSSLVDDQEDEAGGADAVRSEAAGSTSQDAVSAEETAEAESAEERAAIIQQQNEAYAVAEAADRARQERQADSRPKGSGATNCVFAHPRRPRILLPAVLLGVGPNCTVARVRVLEARW